MDFVIVAVVFGVFFLGLVLMFQAFIGREIRSEGAALGQRYDLEHPGITHPAERHRWRLAATGIVLVAVAIVLGIVLM